MTKDQLRQYTNYFIIALLSLLSCAFLPMVGSTVGLGWNFPNTTVGWIVWISTKVIVAALNLVIFCCFVGQARINVKDDPHYIEANAILDKARSREHTPQGPRAHNVKIYGFKGTSILFSSFFSAIALTQAILSYDLMSLLTYVFTITMGIVFGIIQMRKEELYWTDEYYMYALKIQADIDSAKETNNAI